MKSFNQILPKFHFFIVVDKEVNAIIISCRGSSCTDDFITDSMGNGVNFDGGQIHQGIFNTATYVFLRVQNTVIELNSRYNGEVIKQENEDQIQSNNDKIENPDKMKIIVTGHSLGAGVASMVAHLFKKELPQLDVRCICFAPPPTVSFDLWVKSTSYVKSFMIEGDMVPFLSVQNILKFSKILFPDDRFVQRFVERYIKKMSIDEVSETFMKQKLYPPGELYLIRLPQTNPIKSKIKKHQKLTKEEKNELRKKTFIKPKNISLCQIYNPEYFLNFVKNIQESNHKCKNYIKAIIRIRQQQIQDRKYRAILTQRSFKRIKPEYFDETEEDGFERLV